MSETIRVRSQLGRYLEHSRIMWFAHGDVSGVGTSRPRATRPSRCTSSARPTGCSATSTAAIEVLVPVSHPKHQVWLDHVFLFLLAADTVRWELDHEGIWHRRGPEKFSHGDGQERFYRWVADRQRR